MFTEMDFVKVIDSVCRALDEASVRYALIGGFARGAACYDRFGFYLDVR
jgi:hypothetical protein